MSEQAYTRPDYEPTPAEPGVMAAFDRAERLAMELTELVGVLEERIGHVLRGDEPPPADTLTMAALDRSMASGFCTELLAHGAKLQRTIDHLRTVLKRIDL